MPSLGEPVEGGTGWKGPEEKPHHLLKFEGDMDQLALLSRQSLGFLFFAVGMVVLAVSPWGQVHRAPRGRT